MTPLEQKLEQLKLATMSQKLEQTLKEAAAKNLSFTATLECPGRSRTGGPQPPRR